MWILTILLATSIALLSSTVTPSLAIYAGVLNLTLIIILIFLFYGSFRQACLFLLVSAIVISILSGTVLIYIILPNFLLVLLYFFLSARRIITRPSTLASFVIFFAATILVELISMLVMQYLSFSLTIPAITSAIYNAIVGGIVYYFCNKIYYFLNPQLMREKVIISHF